MLADDMARARPCSAGPRARREAAGRLPAPVLVVAPPVWWPTGATRRSAASRRAARSVLQAAAPRPASEHYAARPRHHHLPAVAGDREAPARPHLFAAGAGRSSGREERPQPGGEDRARAAGAPASGHDRHAAGNHLGELQGTVRRGGTGFARQREAVRALRTARRSRSTPTPSGANAAAAHRPLPLRRRKDDVPHDLPAKNEILRRVGTAGRAARCTKPCAWPSTTACWPSCASAACAERHRRLDALLSCGARPVAIRVWSLDAARGVRESGKLDLLLDSPRRPRRRGPPRWCSASSPRCWLHRRRALDARGRATPAHRADARGPSARRA